MACRYCEELHHITKSSPRRYYRYCPMCAQDLCPPCELCNKPVNWQGAQVMVGVGGALSYMHSVCLEKLIALGKKGRTS